jgi:hypothetical protein
MAQKTDTGFNDWLKHLFVGWVCVVCLVLPVTGFTQNPGNQITIEGKDRSTTRISFQYSTESDTRSLQFESGDVPEQFTVQPFDEPSLEKDATRTSQPRFLRADRTAVQEYSLLEIIGIGAGAFALLLVL